MLAWNNIATFPQRKQNTERLASVGYRIADSFLSHLAHDF